MKRRDIVKNDTFISKKVPRDFEKVFISKQVLCSILVPTLFPGADFSGPLIIFLVFLRSNELKLLMFDSKLHVFAIKTVISPNLPKRISVSREIIQVYITQGKN